MISCTCLYIHTHHATRCSVASASKLKVASLDTREKHLVKVYIFDATCLMQIHTGFSMFVYYQTILFSSVTKYKKKGNRKNEEKMR